MACQGLCHLNVVPKLVTMTACKIHVLKQVCLQEKSDQGLSPTCKVLIDGDKLLVTSI